MNGTNLSITEEFELHKKLDLYSNKIMIEREKEFKDENDKIWADYLSEIFELTSLKSREWKNNKKISDVLKILANAPGVNYVYYPDIGGDEIDCVKYSKTSGHIKLYSSGDFIEIKPIRLEFEFLDEKLEWSYFRLETEFCSQKCPYGVFVIVKKSSAFNHSIIDSGFHNKISAQELKKIIHLGKEMSGADSTLSYV